MIQVYSHGLKEFIGISFRHQRFVTPQLVPFTETAEAQGHTRCVVFNVKGLLATGGAWCSVHDNYSKEVGRQISLSRALDVFPALIAEEIFMEYENRDRSNGTAPETNTAAWDQLADTL